MHEIVIWDPEGTVSQGTNLECEKNARQIESLRARGAVLFPSVPDRLAVNPVGGPYIRHWGEGWDFESAQAVRGCPMLNYVTPEMTEVHWAARIEPNATNSKPSGILRLVALSGVMGSVTGGLTRDGMPVDLAKLPKPDSKGGWIIRGKGSIASTVQGYFASTLYGYTTGVRVKWSAVSFV